MSAAATARAMAAAARIGFRHHLAYRSEIVLQLVSATMVAALHGSLWTAATATRPVIAGEPGEQWRALVLVSWIGVATVATRVHEDIGGRFRDGQIAADLLRPLSLQAGTWARDAGRAAACLLLNTVPLLVMVGLVMPFPAEIRAVNLGLWALSLALAQLCSFGVSFLIGIGAARLGGVLGLAYLKATLVSLLSGAVVPLELFPRWAQEIAFALPFQAMARAPALVLLGRADAGAVLAGQAAWAAGLWLAGVLLWRQVAHTLTVEGG